MNDKEKLLRDFGRMCYKAHQCNVDACPFFSEMKGCEWCDEFLMEYPEVAERIIKKWGAEHPVMKIFDIKTLNGKHSWDYFGEKTPEDDGGEPIIETEQEIYVGDVLEINGVVYTVHMTSLIRQFACVSKIKGQKVFMEGEEPQSQEYESNLICPYCGYENIDSWELDEEEGEYICPNCRSALSYVRHVTVEYSAYPIKKADVKRL